MSKLSPPMGLADIVKLMGKTPTESAVQWLRRTIKRRERMLGEKFLHQTKPRGPHTVTLAVLEEKMPDLFSRSDVTPVVDALGELHEEMDELREREEILNKKYRELLERVKNLERQQPSAAVSSRHLGHLVEKN